MLQSRGWLKVGTLVVFSSAALCCTVLGIQLLTQDKTAKAGIATLTFNFTDIHLPNPLIKPRAIPGSDLIQPLQSEAQSAASVLAIATAAAGSKIQSVAGAAQTAVSKIDAIEALIPRNCSLGIKQFCVGFSNYTKCNDLPLNISDIIPETITSFIGNEIQSLQPLEAIMAKVTPIFIQDSLVFGLGILVVMAAIFLCLIFKLISVATLFLRLGVGLLVILCSVPFVTPTTILYHVQSEINGLGSVVGIEKGDAAGQYMGALVCAGVMMLLTIFMSFIM